MSPKTLLTLVALFSLSGCIATPRIEFAERINFDYIPASYTPMTQNDLMCCEYCSV
jgi:ABC-type microcin C transport system permease subunit YejE